MKLDAAMNVQHLYDWLKSNMRSTNVFHAITIEGRLSQKGAGCRLS